MNRRGFLKLCGIAVAGMSLPVAGTLKENPYMPQDYKDRIDRLTQKTWDGKLFTDTMRVVRFNTPTDSGFGIWSVDTAIPEGAA